MKYTGIPCAACGKKFTAEDDVVVCPECGTPSVFEEDELLDGAPKCPNCGEPLDFEVTEE